MTTYQIHLQKQMIQLEMNFGQINLELLQEIWVYKLDNKLPIKNNKNMVRQKKDLLKMKKKMIKF